MFQLGDIQFEGLRGFDTLRKTREAVYAELPLVQGKPRLQRTGTALQSITVGIVLHAAFTDPSADITALDEYREAGEILPLITGTGEIIGDFIILGIDETVVQTAPNGRTLNAQLSLTLKEHFDPNKPATLAAAAKSAAFAVGADKVVPVRLVRPPITSFSVTSLNVTAGNSASIAAIEQARSASLNPAQQASILLRAKSTLENAKNAYQKAKDTAELVDNITSKAPQLLAVLASQLANIALLSSAIVSGDLTNILSATDVLEAGLPAVADAIRPVNAILMSRQPQ